MLEGPLLPLAWGVALRELLHVVVATACCVRNPLFLVVDVAATLQKQVNLNHALARFVL